MDCGPAALKCLLEGFGQPVSYDRLREACQTSLDGTSIDTLEKVAVQLGFHAEQVMLPLDHLALPEAAAFPCLLVVTSALGLTHFLVAWRRHGPWVQVMDPASGRRFLLLSHLLAGTYVHTLPVPAEAWRAWAGSEEALAALRARCGHLRVPREARDRLIGKATADPGWRSLATLDAALRLVGSMVQAGALRRGREAAAFLAATEAADVPAGFWSVTPGTGDGSGQLLLRGAVLVRFRGRIKPPESADGTALSPEIEAALAQPTIHPGRTILRFLREEGRPSLITLAAATVISSAAVVAEALLFRGLFDLLPKLVSLEQRLAGAAAFLVFLLVCLLLEVGATGRFLALGRRLEIRLRVLLLEKTARLGDRYFRSRLRSDMAERSHNVYRLRLVPELAGNVLRSGLQLVATAAGILWLDPGVAPLALLSTGLALGLPLAAQPVLMERDMRVRNHAGALGRFSLDALLGLVPARHHGAERPLRREHEGLLIEWMRAGLRREILAVVLEMSQALSGYGLAVWIVVRHLNGTGDLSQALLLCFWAVQLMNLGQQLDIAGRQVPPLRNAAVRLLEPLGAVEAEPSPPAPLPAPPTPPPGEGRQETTTSDSAFLPSPGDRAGGAGRGAGGEGPSGVSIRFEDVRVMAAGHAVLEGIDLSIEPGEHLAIVGRSGAGKTSLVSLLLGWHVPAAGRVVVDGETLTPERLDALRRETAWVDPEVQLWNAPLLENLLYGAQPDEASHVGQALAAADLRAVLEELPQGLRTPLGEGGALVSGGEGQRVRLGRALLRREARLVILDEPFRGLDRSTRRRLAERARTWWPRATLVCISHDIEVTRSFDRVAVIDGGRLAEHGAPEDLAGRDSHYRALLDHEAAIRRRFRSDAGWRRLRMEGGRLQGEPPAAASTPPREMAALLGDPA
jgi:ATP-binding cassette subfamily B protein